MKICGIICEYNPFHNGHLFHISETRARGQDAIVCVMSGNFVQRADFAILPKLARAESAVRMGADLVILLPLPWSIASAERFALGAVSILNSLGCVTSLSFGCETPDTKLLTTAAEILSASDFSEALMSHYNAGISFAAARQRAVRDFNRDAASLLSMPNNILAVEYIKAILKLRSDIAPICIQRDGAVHDGADARDGFASAAAIRGIIADSADFSHLVPNISAEIFAREHALGHAPVFTESADTAMMTALKKLLPSDFAAQNDVSEGLEYRLEAAIAKSVTLEAAIDSAKTKRYAHSRIRRILLNAFLGVPPHFASQTVPYAHILAFNERGQQIIKLAKKSSNIPIITRPSSIKNEDENARRIFILERYADDVYSLFMQNPLSQGSTFTTTPYHAPRQG